MNRSPWEFFRTPPSPRTPSVTRMPRTDGGHTMPVGWNWTNSMSIRSAPDHSARAWPSPVYSQEFTRLAAVGDGAGDPFAVLQQLDHRAFHEHVDPLVHCVVLERPDHLQAG